MRKKSSEHAAKIEQARLTSSESKIFYSYISNSAFTPAPTELLVDGVWVDTPEGIKNLEEENLSKHMYGRAGTFHSEGARPNPFCEPTKAGLKLRIQVATGKSDKWKQFTPPKTQEFFSHGRCTLTKEQQAGPSTLESLINSYLAKPKTGRLALAE